jgi:hypothetical protein
LNWSIIDLARERAFKRKDQPTRDSRVGILHFAGGTWQVAAGGDRMYVANMCTNHYAVEGGAGRCWLGGRFGGAHRESSPSIPPLQLPA